MSYADKIKEMTGELRGMRGAIPDVMVGFGTMEKAANAGTALEPRHKELIALGMAVVQRCEPCIMFHVRALKKHGGTREELAEMLGIAIQMSGGPGMMYGAHALACWDELAEA